MTTWSGTIIALIIIFCYELYVGRDRHRRRATVFEQAQNRAREVGRPLIVIGDPHNGLGSNFYSRVVGDPWGYDLGDCHIDIAPCDRCASDARTIQAELGAALSERDSDSAVIFVSCVLEYIHPLEPTVEEIRRVAGHSDNIFVVYSDRWSLSAISYPGWLLGHSNVCNVIASAPPDSPTLRYRTLC